MSISKMYNNAIIAPENNSGWSGQTILKMEEVGFPFLYYSRKRKPKEKDSVSVDPYYAIGRNDFAPGYAVTQSNRIHMLAKLEQYIRLGDIKIKSERFISEVRTFVVTDTNRPEALRGKNDDLVMALAGALWVREESFLSSYRSDEIVKAMLAGISTESTTTKDFPIFNINSADSIHGRTFVKQHLEEQNKIQLGDGSIESLAWLIGKG